MATNKQITNAFSWQLFNISLQALLQFAFIMISARVLPKEVHGAFAILNAIIFVLSIASEGGVSSAIIQRKDVNEKHISISFYITLFLSLLLFVVIISIAYPVSDFYEGKITPLQIQCASLIFIFKALGAVSRAFLIKNFKYKKLFIANNLSFFLGNIVVMTILAFLDFGVYAFIFSFIAAQFFKSSLFYFFERHSLAFNWGKKELNQISYFGSSFILLRIVNYFSSQADKLLIGRFYSVVSLSIFEKGHYISKMPPKYIGNSIDSVMFTSITKMDTKKKQGFFNLVFKGVLIFALYIAVVLFFNAKVVVEILLGNNWYETIPFLKIFVFIIPAVLIGRMGDVVVRAENKMFQSLPVKISFLIIIVSTILLFKDLPLIELTVYVVNVHWMHALGMLFLSKKFLELNTIRLLKNIGLIFAITLLIVVKYIIVDLLIDNYWIQFITSIVTDVILLTIVLRHFRSHKIVMNLKNIILKKFKKNKVDREL